jgi:hypothetical protein
MAVSAAQPGLGAQLGFLSGPTQTISTAPSAAPVYANNGPQWQPGNGGWQNPVSGATTPTQTVGGLPSFNYNPAYGGTPAVPNPTTTALQSIEGNTSNLGANSNLTIGNAETNAEAAGAAIGTNLPGYAGLVGQQSSNIMSELEGVLPADVLAVLQQDAGQRGIGTGQTNSPNDTTSWLQSLGLNMLGVEQTGTNNLQTAIGETPTGPAVSATSNEVTPAQQQTASQQQSLYEAAPVPGAAAAANSAAAQAGLGAGAGAAGTAQPGQPPAFTGQQITQQTAAPVNGIDAGTVSALTQAGYSQADIANMTPQQAQQILGNINSTPITIGANNQYTPPSNDYANDEDYATDASDYGD